MWRHQNWLVTGLMACNCCSAISMTTSWCATTSLSTAEASASGVAAHEVVMLETAADWWDATQELSVCRLLWVYSARVLDNCRQ